MDAKKLIKKHDRSAALKNLSYLIGFPLFFLVVCIGSIPFIGEEVFSKTWFYGIAIACAAWFLVTILQLIVAIFTRNYTGRAICAIIFTLIVMVGGFVFFDYFWANKNVEEIRVELVKNTNDLSDEQYDALEEKEQKALLEKCGVSEYKDQVSYYSPWTTTVTGYTKEYMENIEQFMRVYNVPFISEVKGSVNTDGSEYGETTQKDAEGNPEYWFGEKGKYYSKNGLYADGYIFSAEVARNILISYNSIRAYYDKNKDITADEALEAELAKVEASTTWKNYTKTEEYKAVYGVGGTANNYMVTEERLDKIIRALGQQLVAQGVYDKLAGINVAGLIDVGEVLADLGITKSDLQNITLEKLVTIIQGLGLDLDADSIMALLSTFSNYQSPELYPSMYYIEDPMIREYAYAKYYATVHGANIGSVLATDDPDGSLGQVSMSTSGYPASFAYELNDLYLLKAQTEIATTYYPLFAARRYTLIFAGIICFAWVGYYYLRLKAFTTSKKMEFLVNRQQYINKNALFNNKGQLRG